MKKYEILLGWCAVLFVAFTCLLYMIGTAPAVTSMLGWAAFWIVFIFGGGLMVWLEHQGSASKVKTDDL